MATYFTVTIL